MYLDPDDYEKEAKKSTVHPFRDISIKSTKGCIECTDEETNKNKAIEEQLNSYESMGLRVSVYSSPRALKNAIKEGISSGMLYKMNLPNNLLD